MVDRRRDLGEILEKGQTGGIDEGQSASIVDWGQRGQTAGIGSKLLSSEIIQSAGNLPVADSPATPTSSGASGDKNK